MEIRTKCHRYSIKFTQIIILCVVSVCAGISATTTSNDIFYFEIKENSPPNSYVGRISVKNGFTYRFNDEPPEFQLDPKTGVILTTTVPTDRETKNFYNLVILSSSPTYPLEVKIKILDINDNTPYWPSYINTNLSFSESAPIGTKVIVDTAIDPDEGHLNYHINTNENTDNIYFSTNSLPFKLSYNISSAFLHLEVSDKLDREAQSSYVLNISAIDEGFRSSSVLFYVKILDSNDNPPIFDHSDYSVSLNENVGKDVSILQVRATDADEEGNDNSRISYYLLSNESFNIDSYTGVITTAHDGPINCGTGVTEQADSDYWKICVFTVFAHDYGSPRQDGRTYVTAKIQDSNNHSPVIRFRYFSRSDHASVDESAANGSVVAAVSVVDLDHGLNGMTTIDIVDGDRFGHFRLDSIGNSHIIRVNGSLDREKISSYNLTIRAYDQGSPVRSSSAYLIVVVYDHNDHSPKFSKDIFETTITESQNQIGVYVMSLSATDLDEGINSNLFYTLSGPNSHYFRINSITGLITTDKVINREEIDSFELRVTARDGGSSPKWAHALLKIKVLDINDEIPVIEFSNDVKYNNKSQSFEAEVEENSILNITLKTVDKDLGLNGTVDLNILYDYNGLFRIDDSLKHLVSTKTLDYEECKSYKLLIVSKDRALPEYQLSSTTTIFIRVLDRDDISPVVYPKVYYSFVPLNQNQFNYSIVVSRVSVKDFDSQTAVNFVIHSYDSLVPQMFALTRNGEIKLRNSINFRGLNKNLPNFVKFNVGCNGCRKESNDSQFNIYLITSEMSHLSREIFKRDYSFDVKEDQPIGSVVGKIDIDIRKYKLYIVSGDVYNHFGLSDNLLKINRFLDRETKDSYKLQIIAANNQYFFHIDVNINILDVNDCHPVFQESYVEIDLNEDSPPNFTLFTLKAIDPDSYNQLDGTYNSTFIEYKLNSNPKNLFYINKNQLKLKKPLNNLLEKTGNRRSDTITILELQVIVFDKLLVKPLKNFDSKSLETLESGEYKFDYRKLDNKLTIFVKIKKVNRFRPRFDKTFYEISISESTTVNQQFLKINAIDDDGDDVGFNITNGNINDVFGIFPDGNLYVKDRLDRESFDVFYLTINVFEINSMQSNRGLTEDWQNSCKVLIHLNDINDNWPQFLNTTFNFTISENMPINSLIGQVMASDADIGPNSEIKYSIIKSYYSSYVEIDSNNGYIWSKTVFDREMLSSFEIIVQAMDQPIDEERFSSQTVVRIDILDVNDNQPIFEVPNNVTLRPKLKSDSHLNADLIVSEDLPISTTLTTFKATDLDIESNIIYKIVNSSNSQYFSLNERSGVLTLERQLDRESIDRFDVNIEAFDGHFRSYFKLSVIVEDVNDCAPVWVNFTKNHITIPENISIGTEILKLEATDNDIGVNSLVRFEIQSSAYKKYFDILKQSLVVVNKLDYETERVHILNITAIDEMGLKSELRVLRIDIQDVNDCSPIFSQKTDSEVIRVSENIEIGAKLLTLQAFDCDSGDVLTYEIISCDTHYQTRKKSLNSKQNVEIRHKYDSNNCALKIDSKNGEIININSLDREVIESINLRVKVTDSAGHSDKKKFIFLIDDINDEKPFFISADKIIVKKENYNQNKVIGRIEAVDQDIGINSAITYKMVSSEYSPFLSLDPQSGLLTATKKFESLNRNRFMINVLATDGSGLSTSDNVTFIILPETLSNINPSVKTISVDVFENEPLGTRIGKLECSPQRSHQSKRDLFANYNQDIDGCEYHIVNSTDRTFVVDSQTGAVYIDGQIDREVRDHYQIEVLLMSKYGLEKNEILINILDQNDNPPYLKNTSVSVHISESSPIDLEIFDLSKLIADEDTNNKFDFQIINCSNCEDGLFILNRKTGVIKLKSRLDREKVSSYRMLFGVSDGIYLLTSALDIFVDDENDNIPHFNATQYTFDIEENTERGVVVGQVFAFDEDISSRQMIYAIIDQKPTDNVFSLDARNGQFTLTKHLDYESDPIQYTITCEASDGYFKSERVKVIFNLINVEDNPPVFNQNTYRMDVFENISTSQILCVSATDADSLGPIDQNNKKQTKLEYYFESDSNQQKNIIENFEIDSNSGCISIKEELDREKKSSYELIVTADDGTFKARANIQIKVLDVNDNYPFFDRNTPKTLKIFENSAIDTIVYGFRAYDLDEAPNNYIQYDIVLKDDSMIDSFPFTIGTIDGFLKISGPIDREMTDSYEFSVRAKDYGLKSCERDILIEVIDVIDNPPHFTQNHYEVNLFENTTIDDIVLRLRATDLDETDKIYYKIIAGDELGHFKINDDYIVVSMHLDFEQIKTFNLKVNAIDSAGNSDTANVRINIINVLDESPHFFNSPYYLNWCENEVGVIGQFEAILEKLDSYQPNHINSFNNRVNYLLINNYEQYFSLNSTNGVLSVIKPIDRESFRDKPEIELRMIAIDSRSPRLTGEGIIHLTIFDINDNEPVFTQAEYKTDLNENQIYDIYKPIATLSASDKDSNDKITYHFIPDSDINDKFHINETTGQVYLKSQFTFDREFKDRYNIRVKATDSKFESFANLFVTINDINDCSPKIISVNNEGVSSSKVNLSLPFAKLNSILQKDFQLFGVKAFDCDLKDSLNSRIQFKLNSSSFNFMKIDENNGVVKVDQRIGQNKDLSVILIATDMSDSNPLFSSIEINLKITNENHFKESVLVKPFPMTLRVSELTKLNQTVFSFETLSSDVKLSILGGDPNEHFYVEDKNLKIKEFLNFENIKEYQLYFEANNGINEFQYLRLDVKVLNENDLPPKFDFDFYNVSVLEEVDDPVLVTQVVATDIESDTQSIKYKIISPKNSPFKVDPNLGEIWTNSKIDREVNSEFDLIISAEDEGGLSSTCTVHVTVLDKNDNPPRFTRLFRANITENAPIGTFVIQVTSSDRDVGSFSRATYNFMSPSEEFQIDSNTGKVFVTKNLDREIKEEYLLLVSANDGSWRAQTTLTINILDENDSSPKFDKSFYEFHKTIGENNSSNNSSLIIGKVNAMDSDKEDNALITYKLKHKSQYFSIDSKTGVITTKQSSRLTYNSELIFLNRNTLTVLATDKGQIPNTSEVKVYVNILPNKVTKAGKQNPNHMIIAIPYDLKNNTVLLSLNTTIESEETQSKLISIDSNKVIFFGESVVKSSESYKFKLITDSRHIIVDLHITRPNSFAPEFQSSQKQVIVSENQPKNQIIFNGKAKDNDSDYFNNLINYEFNVTKLVWHQNAYNYLKNVYGKQKPNLFTEENNVQNNVQNIIDNIQEIQFIRNPFNIDSKNGSIILKNSLDYELVTNYKIEITAADIGWFSRTSSLDLDVIISDIVDGIGNLASESSDPDLITSSVNPDPMSIGVILVITFFLILILVISTSFLIFHNQKKNQLRECNTNQRKMTATIKPYMTATPSPPSTLMPPQSSLGHNGAQHSPIHTIQARMPAKQPDVVSPVVPPVERPRPVPPAVPASITHSHCTDNFNDNYSNILANTTEHYDLENASSIAPSDIDIVYHYKGFRNRDTQPLHHRHAPLARLSPSVSELSSMPRILTLQDLSPQVPPCPPLNNRTPKPKPINNSNEEEDEEEEDDDDDNNTDDSFTCSEFDQNYEITKKDKNMIFQRVW